MHCPALSAAGAAIVARPLSLSPFVAALRRNRPALPLALACTLALPALAIPALARADDDASATQLDTVTVRANPLGQTADQLVSPAQVLSGEALDEKRRSTIGETLAREPGVSSTSFGGGAARPVIRGQAGPRVEVLANGLSASDVSDVSPDHAVAVAPAGATQIEVLKGPATLLYGSGASGGVVNIIDGRLPTEVTPGLHGVAEAQYGSNGDERSFSTVLEGGLGHHQFHLDANETKVDDYGIPRCAGVDGSGSCGTLANSSTQALSGAFGYGYVTDDGSISVSASPYHTRYSLPAEAAAFIDLDQTRYDLQGVLARPLPGLASVKLRAAYATYTHTEFEDAHTPGTRFDNRRNEQRLELVHEPFLGFRGALGVQHSFRQFDAVGDEALTPPSNTENLGVFLIEERRFGWGKLEFGGRYQDDSTRRTDQANADTKHYTPLSASAGAVIRLTPQNHLRIGYTHSERSPVAQELYSFGPHGATSTFERGDDRLGLERVNNFEIGLDHHDGRLTASGALFWQRALGYIDAVEVDRGLNADGSGVGSADGIADRVDGDGTFNPAGDYLLVDFRQRNARFYGVEGRIDYVLLQGPLKLSGNLFGDVVRAKVDGGGNIPRTTPARAGVGVDGRWQRWYGSIDYLRVFDQTHVSALETPTAGYDDLRLEFGWRFRLPVGGDAAGDNDSRVYVRARNLTDAEQRRSTSFIKDVVPEPGRSIIVGVRVAF